MKLRTLLFLIVLVGGINRVSGQTFYGTTGLLHAPTADMQKDKTFMVGVNMLDVNTLSQYWVRKEYHPYTYNYYINVTIFPWLEVAYTCTLVKGLHGSSYWPQQTWGKFVNQDRSFHGRLRLWKEGNWKDWMPQVVLGTNDPGSHSSNGGGEIDFGGGNGGNHNYLTRYYLAATKHFNVGGGVLGIHAAWILGRAMSDVHYSRPSVGGNFQWNLEGNEVWQKVLNSLNLMAEICPGHTDDVKNVTYDINVGAHFHLWKDHINLIAELNDGKYFSGGILFKVHLK